MITYIKRGCVSTQYFYHYNYKSNENFNIYASTIKEQYEHNVEYIPRVRTYIDTISPISVLLCTITNLVI